MDATWVASLSIAGGTDRWQSQASGYLGVRFYQPDGLHYGWIRALLSSPMVVDWAYETRPDKPIRAGDIDSTRESVQFTVEFLTPHPRPRHPAQVVGTGSLILRATRSAANSALPANSPPPKSSTRTTVAPKTVSCQTLVNPSSAQADHTAFFHDATLTRSQVNQLLHGEYYVSIDNGALAARILPAPPLHHYREDKR